MKIAYTDYSAQREAFDTLIDVRSPAEYAEDHIPGAINLPVLSNEERAKVGTIYVQEDPFMARKIGAALVAKNTAMHLETCLADKPGAWRPLVYCWRGGQRSGSFATILKEIGWRVSVLEGGYKSYRRAVQTQLYQGDCPWRFVLLDGNTGTGKTALIARLAVQGVQTLDLEGLANHRGSLFGHRPGGQPSQKAFESALADALRSLDPARPILAEAESSKIGRLMVPPVIWQGMEAAPRIIITAPLEARAQYLARDYRDIVEDEARLVDRIGALGAYQSHETIRRWQALALDHDHESLAAELMAEHYDPRYRRERTRHERPCLAQYHAETLDLAGLDALSNAVIERLSTLD